MLRQYPWLNGEELGPAILIADAGGKYNLHAFGRKFQDIVGCRERDFSHKEITRTVEGQAPRIIQARSKRGPNAARRKLENSGKVYSVKSRYEQIVDVIKGQSNRTRDIGEGFWADENTLYSIRGELVNSSTNSIC